MSLHLLASYISLSPCAPGDSGLNQFLGDHAYHISQLQGKERVYRVLFLYFNHADVLQLLRSSTASMFSPSPRLHLKGGLRE